MTFYTDMEDRRARGAPPQLQHMRMMERPTFAAPNAGFAGSWGHQLPPNKTAHYADSYFHHHGQAVPPASPEKPFYSPSYAPNTPDSTTSASSYGTDYSDSDADAVDAAMAESGLLTSSLLSELPTGLDFELMREMQELLTSPRASPRASASQWRHTSDWGRDHAPVDRRDANYPVELDASWGADHTSTHEEAVPVSPVKAAPPTPASQPMHFMPQGQGWQVKQMEPPVVAPTTEDVEMDEDVSEAELSEADTMEMQLLMREIKFLEAQREFLDYKASLTALENSGFSSALIHRRDAIEEKRKLMEAKLLQDMFNKAINDQFENLRHVQQQLLESPITHYRNTLMTPMETYIHLSKDMKERRAVLTSMRDEKLDAARRFIEFQSRNIDVEHDFFFLDTFEKFGKFYTVDFSISKLEDTTVDDVAFVFYFHFVFTKDRISKILGSVENREYFDGIDWVFLHGRFVDRINLLKPRRNGRKFVVHESNTVFYANKIGDSFVMTCDNIDKDELHPYRTNGRIRKDMIFGVVVEPYVDSQGKDSVVLKRFSFYRHHFNNIEPTPELMQAISTKVILWGQAVRMCVSSQEKDRLPLPLNKKPLKRAGAPMVLTNW